MLTLSGEFCKNSKAYNKNKLVWYDCLEDGTKNARTTSKKKCKRLKFLTAKVSIENNDSAGGQ